MKDMKKLVMIIMAVALIALPTMGQEQEWQSTSTLQSSGSAYSSQINAVGATAVSSMATTTESYSPANNAPRGPRKDFGKPENPGTQSEEFPLGDAVLPMLLCAAVFCGVIAFRRKRSALNR